MSDFGSEQNAIGMEGYIPGIQGPGRGAGKLMIHQGPAQVSLNQHATPSSYHLAVAESYAG